ncbi:MAG: protein kinase domain-containing protein [Planctomycetota bacterium]
MSQDPDHLFAVLALQTNLITQAQFLECGKILAQDPSRSLADILEERGYLEPQARSALEVLVAERIEQAADDSAKGPPPSPEEEDARRNLHDQPLEEAVKSMLQEWKTVGPGELVIPPEGEFADGGTTVDEIPDDAGVPPLQRAVLREAEPDRYVFKEELGRGGLGTVIEALDTDFGRNVAVKLMIHGQPSAAIERFLLEGRAAGRLMHPNIVPIHEIGVLKQEVGEIPFFTMGKIVGRNLEEILHDIKSGDEETRKKLIRPRLLRVFQEVCNAIAYAHDHGVIHRDLKPANVMVGEYGEVFVVDWGVAKVKDAKDISRAGTAQATEGKPADTPHLTVDGQILGTPAYMPPEQARGRIAEIDERSDIYSLGAILYEILTLRPPFEGATVLQVISSVLTEDMAPPSARVSAIRDAGPSAPGSESLPPPLEDVPPELDNIVLRAMSKEKTNRYATARELSDDVQLYLEGEKERERNHRHALAKVERGKALVEEMENRRADLKEAEKALEEAGKEIKTYQPAEEKEKYWSLEDRVKRLRREIVDAFTEAGNTFQEALGFERRNPQARSALADLYWDQYLRAEESGDEVEILHYEKMVRQYNDGQYDARLKGDGTLTVSARRYPCRCLTQGRTVAPDELELMGYHFFSGRSLRGEVFAKGLPELEPEEPVHLKVHGSKCMKETLDGVEVWLFRYEERNRILLPVFPSGVKTAGALQQAVPGAVLDRVFDEGSPFRPGEGLHLGRTPVTKFDIPMGSYLLILHKEGFHPVRYPITIDRLAHEEVNVTFFQDGEIPEGFVQVPAGKFIYQGDLSDPLAGPRETKEINDFFVYRFPVTCSAYREFLNDLSEEDPEEAARRAPRESEEAGHYWPADESGKFVIPTERWLAQAPEALRKQPRRLAETELDWEERWPVYGISWEDAVAYCAWFTRKKGILATLPHEEMREKAARGTDGRLFTFGNHFDHRKVNVMGTHMGGSRPCSVNSFPTDESPYGARGMGGNSTEWCINDADHGRRRLLRGGSWFHSWVSARTTQRKANNPAYVARNIGFRLIACPSPGL